ncbi:MAG: hypothetical protein HZA50_12695 [Planctomycetes bacterium]|nr:hypothetical protein [Planctomycetota bacterium]
MPDMPAAYCHDISIARQFFNKLPAAVQPGESPQTCRPGHRVVGQFQEKNQVTLCHLVVRASRLHFFLFFALQAGLVRRSLGEAGCLHHNFPETDPLLAIAWLKQGQ